MADDGKDVEKEDVFTEPEDIGDDVGGEFSGNPSGELLELHEVLEWQAAVDAAEGEGDS